MNLTFAEVLRSKAIDEGRYWSAQIIEAVSSGITIADARHPDMPLIYVNSSFERLTGYRWEEIIGRNCRFLQHTERDQPALEEIRRAIHEGLHATVVLRNYRKDGSLFWNELYLSPIYDEDGDLTHFVGIQNDVTARVEFETNWKFLASHDPLTGLVNRVVLVDRLEKAILKAQRSKHLVAVIFLDLDDFKRVNDGFGHDAGDAILKIVADRIQTMTRASETACRLGGDEFIVLIEDIQEALIAEKVLRRLAALINQPANISGQEMSISASFGMAIYPQDGITPEALIRASDIAMYAAKRLRRRET